MVLPPACSEDKGYMDEVMYYGTKAMVPSCQSHSKAMVAVAQLRTKHLIAIKSFKN
jgi:hypothetical protein